VRVNYATENESATAGNDFTATTGTLIIPPLTGSAQIRVPITSDTYAEPNETFLVRLSAPVNATLATTVARATILDDDGTRVPINTGLPGNYFADGTAMPGYDDYVVIGNRHGVGVTARLTYTKEDGSGSTRDIFMPASSRATIHLSDEPGLAGHEVSVAVQSTDSLHPIDADHSVYWGVNWQAGRSTEGVAPSQTWYFAEGSASSYFDEWITMFNPNATAQDCWMGFYGPFSPLTSYWFHIEPGPGRQKLHINDLNLNGATDHGTRIWCTAPIVAERTMTWQRGVDSREGHSSPGSPIGSTTWYLAEGNTGFSTYLDVLNLDGVATTVRVEYLHENGSVYTQDVAIGAYLRATIQPPAIPAGSFGYRVTSLTGQQIVVERSMYTGADWTVGTSSVATPSLSTQWFFEEGSTGTFWDTYILIANPSASTAHVTLTFTRDDGGTASSSVTIAPNGRATVSVDAIAGVTQANFRTVVSSDQPIVAERATYWPGGGWYGATISLGRKP
jgi:hypothetical protein